jgi:hypothetical protein
VTISDRALPGAVISVAPWPRDAARSASAYAPDALALCTLVALGAWLFRAHLLGRAVYIGDADRLNTFLNILKYQVERIRDGEVPGWSEFMFMGQHQLALPYTFPNPLTYATAFVPSQNLYWVAGVVSCALLILAGCTAYLFIKDSCRDLFPAFIGAALYQLSSLSVLKISQNDMSFAVLVHLPVMLLLLRRATDRAGRLTFCALAIVLASLLWFTFLQKAAYALMLAGAYAAYRSLWWRQWRPVLTFAASLVVALIAASPRLYMVAQEFALLQRTPVGFRAENFDALYEFQNIRPREILRWFDDGIFGRFPTEAAAIGNNINLHEGLLLHTSAFAAFLVVLGVVRFRGEWFRLLRGKDEDAAFHLWCLAFVLSVLLVKPVLHALYLLFGKLDFTHARIVVAGLLPVCTLVAMVLRDWRGESVGLSQRHQRLWPLLAGGLVAAGVLLSIHAASRKVDPPRLLIDEPLSYLTRAAAQGLLWRKVRLQPMAPTALVAERESPSAVALSWRDGAGETETRIEMSTQDGDFIVIGGTGPNRTVYRVGDLNPHSAYRFRVRGCNGEWCSRYSPEARASPWAGGGAVAPPVLSDGDPGATWILAGRLVRLEASALAFVLLVVALWSATNWRSGRLALTYGLGLIMVIEAGAATDFQLNGAHTRLRSVPFQGNNFLAVGSGQLHVPNASVVAALGARLEVDRYRSVIVCDPQRFQTFCAPHLSHFWRLRVAEGYSSGVPLRLARLPWPDGVLSLRALSFASAADLPWPLLALLNVKYAVTTTLPWYLNAAGDSPGAVPTEDDISVNPFPVVPRIFFAASVEPATTMSDAVDRLRRSVLDRHRPQDVTKQSIAEGMPAPAQFATEGEIRATYESDRVLVHVDPSSRPRLLVLNELHHPAWRGFSGTQELPVFPTNVVMRGLVVPPGVAHVEFRFVPFLYTRGAAACLLAAIVVLVAGAWCFRGRSGAA